MDSHRQSNDSGQGPLYPPGALIIRYSRGMFTCSHPEPEPWLGWTLRASLAPLAASPSQALPPLLTPRLRYPMAVWEGAAQKGGSVLLRSLRLRHPWLRLRSLTKSPPLRSRLSPGAARRQAPRAALVVTGRVKGVIVALSGGPHVAAAYEEMPLRGRSTGQPASGRPYGT